MNVEMRYSLRIKLLIILLVSALLSVAIISIAVFAFEQSIYKKRALSQIEKPLAMMKELIQPAIDFQAYEDVARYLQLFGGKQVGALKVAVFDSNSNLIAVYPTESAIGKKPGSSNTMLSLSGVLVIEEDLKGANGHLGSIVIHQKLPSLTDRLYQYVMLMTAVLIAIGLVSLCFYVGAQKLVLTPIEKLVLITKRVAASGDYTIRSDISQRNEVGQLEYAFNDMLSTIDCNYIQLAKNKNKLQETNEVLYAVFEYIQDGVVVCDANGRLTYVNSAMVELLDFSGSLDDLKKEKLNLDLYTPDGLHQMAVENTPLFIALQGVTVENTDMLVKTRARTTKNIVVSAKSLHGVNGEVTGAVAIISDETERKQSAAKLEAVNQELDERVKLRTTELEVVNQELEAFSYSVSHDLRAPLRHISGFVQLLRKRSYHAVDQKSKHYMDVIGRSSIKMGQMIDDILGFSRLSRSDFHISTVDMNEVVSEVVKILQPEAAGRRIAWLIDSLPAVAAEPGMLHRVWLNLISNALKYTRYNEECVIKIGSYKTSDACVFYVKDNGIGFDMAYVDKLFGVFQRLHQDSEFDGNGIGLANVHKIIQRHQGAVWAESQPDNGASFYFSLPTSHGDTHDKVS